jgi:hypothetical protein
MRLALPRKRWLTATSHQILAAVDAGTGEFITSDAGSRSVMAHQAFRDREIAFMPLIRSSGLGPECQATLPAALGPSNGPHAEIVADFGRSMGIENVIGLP